MRGSAWRAQTPSPWWSPAACDTMTKQPCDRIHTKPQEQQHDPQAAPCDAFSELAPQQRPVTVEPNSEGRLTVDLKGAQRLACIFCSPIAPPTSQPQAWAAQLACIFGLFTLRLDRQHSVLICVATELVQKEVVHLLDAAACGAGSRVVRR